MDRFRREVIVRVLIWWLSIVYAMYKCFISMCTTAAVIHRRRLSSNSYTEDFNAKRAYLRSLIYSSDTTCYNQLRMYRATFDRLCCMLDTLGGLKSSSDMLIDEQVALFLHILAHNAQNRVIQFNLGRSGETISRYFYAVLKAMICLREELIKSPEPVPEDSSDETWKWFKNCLGAIDGTHIRIKVPMADKVRYRNRKGEITTNVLGVCSQDGQFTHVLPGWEGSAGDARVLQDAISRHKLEVPQSCYYLVDKKYPNFEGFLAPFRGKRCQLSEWGEGRHPTTPYECFNMRHASAHNVIKRCFEMLKLRWAILRNPPFYLATTHNRVIVACCLLHNLIKRDSLPDPLEDEIDGLEELAPTVVATTISTAKTSDEWSKWRLELANNMFNDFRGQRL